MSLFMFVATKVPRLSGWVWLFYDKREAKDHETFIDDHRYSHFLGRGIYVVISTNIQEESKATEGHSVIPETDAIMEDFGPRNSPKEC